MAIESIEYVPQALRGQELFSRLTTLLDGIVGDVYTPNLDATINAFNPKGSGFDADALFGVIGGPDLLSLLKGSGIPDATLSHLLPRLFNLKGTRRGLDLLLGIVLNESPGVVVGWEAWRGSTRNPDMSPGPGSVYADAWSSFERTYPSLASSATRNGLACRIYIRVGRGGGQLGGDAELSRDQQVLNIVRRFMPVCTQPVVSTTNNLSAFPNRGLGTDRGPDESYLRIYDGLPNASRHALSGENPRLADRTDRMMASMSARLTTIKLLLPVKVYPDGREERMRSSLSANPLKYSSGRAYAAPGSNDAEQYGSPGGGSMDGAVFSDSMRVKSVTINNGADNLPQNLWSSENDS